MCGEEEEEKKKEKDEEYIAGIYIRRSIVL